jgi:hypothetical protein
VVIMKNKVVNQKPLDKLVDDSELNDYSFEHPACGIHQTSQNVFYTLALTHLRNFCNNGQFEFLERVHLT